MQQLGVVFRVAWNGYTIAGRGVDYDDGRKFGSVYLPQTKWQITSQEIEGPSDPHYGLDSRQFTFQFPWENEDGIIYMDLVIPYIGEQVEDFCDALGAATRKHNYRIDADAAMKGPSKGLITVRKRPFSEE